MLPEEKAKALVAGGIVFFVTGLVILLLLVIPAARRGDIASAQGEEAVGTGEEMAPEAPAEGAGPIEPMGEQPPGMEGAGAPGAGPGAGPPAGGGAPQEIAAIPVTEPLETYRANPFAPRTPALSAIEKAGVVGAVRYGPDWSKLPIAEHVALIPSSVPAAPTPPAPVIRPAAAELLRVTSIMWGAEGQALAAYESPDGRTGVLKPGDRVEGWMVAEITRAGVTMRNVQTGEVQQLELRARAEKKEPERPQRPGGATGRERRTGPGGRGRPQRPAEEPAAPP